MEGAAQTLGDDGGAVMGSDGEGAVITVSLELCRMTATDLWKCRQVCWFCWFGLCHWRGHKETDTHIHTHRCK